MCRYALVARTEDGVPAVKAAQSRAATAGIPLVTRRCRVAEIAATHPLAQISAYGGHVSQLRGCAQQQRLRDHRETLHYGGHLGDVAHPRQRADPQPAAWQVLDLVQRKVVDIDQQDRPQDILAHQVYLGRAAGQKRAVWTFPDQRDRTAWICCPHITQRSHRHSPPAASRTWRIAARILGYAAHRQILPLIHSAISASSAA